MKMFLWPKCYFLPQSAQHLPTQSILQVAQHDLPQALQQLSVLLPAAESPVAGFATVSDYIADQFYRVWGERQLTNVLNGYAKVSVLLDFAMKTGAQHWPLVDYMEDAYLGNWNGKAPLAELQFSRNIGAVNIPILAFSSTEFIDALNGRYRYKREGYEMIKSADRQYVLLDGFGHLDILVGEYAEEQVFIPLYNWLQARSRKTETPPISNLRF